MKNIIYTTLGIIGFVILMGTIGAADLERISLSQLAFGTFFSLILIAISSFGLNLEDKRKMNRRYNNGARKKF